ncbi:hypothetical protein EBZ80_02355 [bacterium]|nr:hypothetical protein [bacterium]
MFRTAVCCMTRDAPDLPFWIAYHLRYFDRIFLRVEGGKRPPEDDRVVVVDTTEPEDGGLLRQQERQRDFVDLCVRRVARTHGVRYLLHIDDDELFVMEPRWRDAGSLLRTLAWSGATHARIQNHEAVFRVDPGDAGATPYFTDARIVFRDGARSAFMRGYRNGKSVCDTFHQPRCTGCHTFEGSHIILREAVILHFDCLDFVRWQNKFLRIREITGLLPFYGRSVRAVRTGDEHEQRRVWLGGVVVRDREPLLLMEWIRHADRENSAPGS